jgi:hypothetical protein
VPLVAVIAFIVVGALALRWLFRSPVGEAMAERIRQGRRHGRPAVATEGSPEARALEERVAHLESLRVPTIWRTTPCSPRREPDVRLHSVRGARQARRGEACLAPVTPPRRSSP